MAAHTTSSSSAGGRAEAPRRGAWPARVCGPLLLDAATFPRVKICAGWVTPEALADVEVDPDKYPLTIQPFTACRFGFDGQDPRDALAPAGELRHRPQRVRPPSPGSRPGRRRRRARGRAGDGRDPRAATGCASRASRATSWPAWSSARAAITAPSPRPSARCPSGRRSWSPRRARRGCRPSGSKPCGASRRRPSCTWSRTSRATAGTSPRRTCSTSASACVSGPDANLPRRRDALVASLRASGHLPADLPIEPFRGHAYVVRRRAPRRLAGAGFCLIGDAAGLARDLSGEGIGPAIRSGLLGRRGGRRLTCARARRSTRTPAGSCAGTDAVRRAGSAGSSADCPTPSPGSWCGPRWPPAPRDGTWCSAGSSGCGRCRHEHAGQGPTTRSAIAHHYDVSNEFYALFLDPLMVYTCAYYRDPDGKLEQAQEDKLDHVCRKLELRPGETHARHRLRLGQPGHLGGPALRRARPRRDAVQGPGRLRRRADPSRGTARSVSGRVPGLPGPARRRRATTRSPPSA